MLLIFCLFTACSEKSSDTSTTEDTNIDIDIDIDLDTTNTDDTGPSNASWCDSTWYEAVFIDVGTGGMIGPFDMTLTGYITVDLNDATASVRHSFTSHQSSMVFSNYGNVGSYPDSYTVNQVLVTDTVTVCWGPEIYLNGLNSPDTCGEMTCEDWVYDELGTWFKIM